MSRCQDCVHYEVCSIRPIWRNVEQTEDDCCRHFKPKSRFVELPCAFGDVIYMLVTRKTHSFEYVFKDGKRNMIKQQNQHTFIKDTYFTKLNFWKVLEGWGKTVFPSKEEAEKALRERSK